MDRVLVLIYKGSQGGREAEGNTAYAVRGAVTLTSNRFVERGNVTRALPRGSGTPNFSLPTTLFLGATTVRE